MGLVRPEKNSPEGEYEEPIDPNADDLSAHGFYPQKSTGEDADAGIFRDESNNLVLKDAVAGSFTLAQITAATDHENIDSLVHEIAETCYEEITRDGNGRVQTYIVWTTNAKVTKVREASVSRDGNGKMLSMVEKQYNAAGTLIQTVTRTITRDGNQKLQSFATVET